MAVSTTIEIPEPLHEQLRQAAERSGKSVDALILETLEQTYGAGETKKGAYVTGPMIDGPGKLGPKFPVDSIPDDLLFP